MSLNIDTKKIIPKLILTKIVISSCMQFFFIIGQTLKNNFLDSIILISRDLIFFLTY